MATDSFILRDREHTWDPFDNDTSVIAEGLGIAPYYFVKIPVKAGQGMKAGLQCNIQYAGFRTC